MTVSIRASLLLSALAMAALTAAFVDPQEASDQAKAPTSPPTEVANLAEKPAEPARDSVACITSIQPAAMNFTGAVTADADTLHPLKAMATSSGPRAELPARCAP